MSGKKSDDKEWGRSGSSIVKYNALFPRKWLLIAKCVVQTNTRTKTDLQEH